MVDEEEELTPAEEPADDFSASCHDQFVQSYELFAPAFSRGAEEGDLSPAEVVAVDELLETPASQGPVQAGTEEDERAFSQSVLRLHFLRGYAQLGGDRLGHLHGLPGQVVVDHLDQPAAAPLFGRASRQGYARRQPR